VDGNEIKRGSGENESKYGIVKWRRKRVKVMAKMAAAAAESENGNGVAQWKWRQWRRNRKWRSMANNGIIKWHQQRRK